MPAMRHSTIATGLPTALVAAILAGCGSGSTPKQISAAAVHVELRKALDTPSAIAERSRRLKLEPAPPTRTYTIHLTGDQVLPRGAANGSVQAQIRLLARKGHGSGRVCWRFTTLSGFTRPAEARIHVGKRGTSALTVIALGTAWRPAGCVPVRNGTMTAIAKHPAGHYVDIVTAKYWWGAVRAQL